MVVVALRGPSIRAPPNVIATLTRRHFNGLRGPPVVGAPNATHEGIYLAMEYFENGDLGDIQHTLRLDFPLPEHDVKTITTQLLEGLDFMHKKGYTHRDLGPKVKSHLIYKIRQFAQSLMK
jgi:serine/threonine protein kinase